MLSTNCLDYSQEKCLPFQLKLLPDLNLPIGYGNRAPFLAFVFAGLIGFHSSAKILS